jgi:hypothetical protein
MTTCESTDCVSRSLRSMVLGVAGRARLSKAGEVNFKMTLGIAGLGPFAPGFELRPYPPPHRAGQQAFRGLVSGAVVRHRPR